MCIVTLQAWCSLLPFNSSCLPFPPLLLLIIHLYSIQGDGVEAAVTKDREELEDLFIGLDNVTGYRTEPQSSCGLVSCRMYQMR
jgi:hypothetical protein